MSSLASLTPDVLGRILAFRETSYASLPLWLSGNALIQRKLALGVTLVSLDCQSKFVICRVPRYLENLLHLRSLTISLSDSYMYYLRESWRTITRLSPLLQELILDYADSFLSLQPSADTTSNPASPEHQSDPGEQQSLWSLKSAYPQLERLILKGKINWTPEDLQNLPASLTSLSTSNSTKGDEFKAFLTGLPPNVVRLTLNDTPEMSASSCLELMQPRPWEHLSFGHKHLGASESYATWPRTLTVLEMHEFDWSLTAAAIKALPPSLTEIVYLESPSGGDTEEANFEHLKSLTSLADDSDPGPRLTPSSIRTLAPTVTSLTMEADLEKIALADWPRDLKRLVWTPLSDSFSLDLLPSRLAELLIQDPLFTLPLSSISLLPRTLVSLRCYCKDMTENVEFPPHLAWLNLLPGDLTQKWVDIEPCFKPIDLDEDEGGDEDAAETANEAETLEPLDVNRPGHLMHMPPRPKVTQCFPFHKLPQGIHNLYLPCLIPASKLRFLPPILQTLSVFDIFEDADFDPLSVDNLEHMRKVYQIGKVEVGGVGQDVFHLSAEDASSASPSSLLPRTLQSLSLKGDFFASNADWKRIPPALTHLRGSMEFRSMDPDILFVAPFTRLQWLYLKFPTLNDAHIKALPRRLCGGGDFTPIEGELTVDSVTHWPLNMETYYIPVDHLSRVAEKIAALRQSAMKEHNDDPTVLRDLLRPENFNFETEEDGYRVFYRSEFICKVQFEDEYAEDIEDTEYVDDSEDAENNENNEDSEDGEDAEDTEGQD